MDFMDKEMAIERMMNAAYMKIFLNYTQGIMIINSLRMNWNHLFDEVVSYFEPVSGNVGKIISVECIVEGISILFSGYFFFFRFFYDFLL